MRRFACLVVFLASLAGTARAAERIIDFGSDIAIRPTGSLDVVETIAVDAENNQIRHGIYRDFPTTYTDKFGRRVRVRFDVHRVTMDGKDAPYALESLTNGKRVRIGRAEVLLTPGEHVFVITYTTDRQIGFFQNFDELYWNVTGNGWNFPIDRAEATVHLPAGASVVQEAFYTGPQGASGKDAGVERVSDDVIRFATTAPLDRYEGLTIGVGFTKGVVVPPTASESAREFASNNAGMLAAAIGLIVLSIYYVVAWARHGRDPARGSVIPLFAPPTDFSPAGVRYVHRMGYGRKCYASTLVQMAVKGYLRIADSGRKFVLTRTGKSDADCGFSPTEVAVADSLFNGHTTIELKQENHTQVAASISALKGALRNEYKEKYFRSNSGWLLGGIGILIATIAAAVLLPDDVTVQDVLSACAVGAVGTVLSVVFFFLLKAPTALGAHIRDEIDGFKLFLDTAEKDRLEMLNPPNVTPEVFEKFLPYAIALDCENEWSKKFEAQAAAAAAQPNQETFYTPAWYSGTSFRTDGATGFASRIGYSLAASAAAASTAPGSSSGSGGGGSSGGGGGGGGGGGW
jgi:hypothetical protein